MNTNQTTAGSVYITFLSEYTARHASGQDPGSEPEAQDHPRSGGQGIGALKAEEVASKLRALRLDRAARIVAEGCEEPLSTMIFHRRTGGICVLISSGTAESGNPA